MDDVNKLDKDAPIATMMIETVEDEDINLDAKIWNFFARRGTEDTVKVSFMVSEDSESNLLSESNKLNESGYVLPLISRSQRAQSFKEAKPT